jgi:hypothetical protein
MASPHFRSKGKIHLYPWQELGSRVRDYGERCDDRGHPLGYFKVELVSRWFRDYSVASLGGTP